MRMKKGFLFVVLIAVMIVFSAALVSAVCYSGADFTNYGCTCSGGGTAGRQTCTTYDCYSDYDYTYLYSYDSCGSCYSCTYPCTPSYTYGCSGNYITRYNSCTYSTDYYYQYCSYGCSGGACSSCSPTYTYGCSGDYVTRRNSCTGVTDNYFEYCSGGGCYGGSCCYDDCTSASCTSGTYYSCYDSDSDTCLEKVSAGTCTYLYGSTSTCYNNACCTPESSSVTCAGGKTGTQTNNCGQSVNCGTGCTPQASSNCVGNDIYWFDSCGVQGALKTDCPACSTGTGCTSGSGGTCCCPLTCAAKQAQTPCGTTVGTSCGTAVCAAGTKGTQCSTGTCNPTTGLCETACVPNCNCASSICSANSCLNSCGTGQCVGTKDSTCTQGYICDGDTNTCKLAAGQPDDTYNCDPVPGTTTRICTSGTKCAGSSLINCVCERTAIDTIHGVWNWVCGSSSICDLCTNCPTSPACVTTCIPDCVGKLYCADDGCNNGGKCYQSLCVAGCVGNCCPYTCSEAKANKADPGCATQYQSCGVTLSGCYGHYCAPGTTCNTATHTCGGTGCVPSGLFDHYECSGDWLEEHDNCGVIPGASTYCTYGCSNGACNPNPCPPGSPPYSYVCSGNWLEKHDSCGDVIPGESTYCTLGCNPVTNTCNLCNPSCACSSNICVGSTCSGTCGAGTCPGTKTTDECCKVTDTCATLKCLDSKTVQCVNNCGTSGMTYDCAPGLTCSGGRCSCTITNPCASRICSDSTHWQCLDNCNNPGTQTACPSGQTCSGGVCSCVPSTYSYACSVKTNIRTDNCGNTDMWVCNTNENCVPTGTRCVATSCTDTCGTYGFNCGTHNSCGVGEICGNCAFGQTCTNPFGGTCIGCLPASGCASHGYTCGTHVDSCGTAEVCQPGCGTGQTCTNPSGGTCVSTACTDTCATNGFDCGTYTSPSPLCGGVPEPCGNCVFGQTCTNSLGGTCVACTSGCSSHGYECGTHVNSCGTPEPCGTCPTGKICSDLNNGGACNWNPEAYWTNLNGDSITSISVVKGSNTQVNMVLKYTGLTTGAINFEIWEDLLFDKLVTQLSETITNGDSTKTWTITDTDLDAIGSGVSDVHFTVKSGTSEVKTSGNLQITVLDQEICYNINICGDYSDQGNCNSDPCEVAYSTVMDLYPEVTCGSNGYNCACFWDNDNVCKGMWDKANDGVCGDSEINSGEQCDGSNWGSIIGCGNFNDFIGGTLACDSTCEFDTSACTGGTPGGTCGDGTINTGEACDGSDWGSITGCGDFDDFESGTLVCDSNCQFDTSSCVRPTACGDGIIDSGEQCETNADLTGSSCSDFDEFTGGTLSCVNCMISTTACIGGINGICGDGTINTGEQCETNADANEFSCTDFGDFTTGTLSCKNCMINTTACGRGTSLGTCHINQLVEKECDEEPNIGFKNVKWNGTWTGEAGTYKDRCEEGGIRTIQCAAQVQLPFFGFYSVIATSILIALIYIFIISKRKKKH
ncbi:MAG: hypothetical protein NTU63_00260 [Candidatus Pacearchaeota archaeon]|nr:hypothetical protein [Candidatus Pacearchaeota archaeon]